MQRRPCGSEAQMKPSARALLNIGVASCQPYEPRGHIIHFPRHHEAPGLTSMAIGFTWRCQILKDHQVVHTRQEA